MEKEILHGSPEVATLKAGQTCSSGERETPFAFVEKGCIGVSHRPEGPFPVVIPCPGVRLIINDQECTQPTPVSKEDKVQVEMVDERREGEWSVSISADGLQAILRICPTVVIHRQLADLPATNKLYLSVIEREEYLQPLTRKELLQELSRLGIKHGVDWIACSQGIASCTAEELVIARGIPAEPGEDGWIELLFPSDSVVPILAKQDEPVDFRKRYVFNSVEAGEILAVKHPPGPGRPGTSIKGDIIVPPQPRDFTLAVGEGAMLANDGKRAVAVRAGRPVASRSGNLIRVNVLPKLVHPGDVDLASGNIAFKGDVQISGNVENGMTVEASGNITVEGLVSSGAKIQAAGLIVIKGNVSSSLVSAGGTPAFMQEILSQVRSLATGLREMTMAVQQLLGRQVSNHSFSKRDLGSLIKLLLEGKFRHLPIVAEAFNKQRKTLPAGFAAKGLDDFIQEVTSALQTPLAICGLKELESLAQRALEWEQFFACPPSPASDVMVSGILNSTITATGNVTVLDGGSYNSRIQAGKKVTVSRVFRGGEIIAGGDVHLDEMGSEGGVATRVVTGPKAVVTVKYAFENSSIVLGGRVYHVNEEKKILPFF